MTRIRHRTEKLVSETAVSAYKPKCQNQKSPKPKTAKTKLYQRSQLLAETEFEIAEPMQSMLETFKFILEETQKHTQYRAACDSLFLGPSEIEILELYKYEHELE